MLKLFRRRSPAHRATPSKAVSAKYGYRFVDRRPEPCSPCVDLYGIEAVTASLTSTADVLVASAWGLNLVQWWGLSEFERSECRRNVTAAPRFVS